MEVPPAAKVPEQVARTRNSIIDAALDCDYALLEHIALGSDGSFQYSHTEESAGPGAQPAKYWKARERAGDRILANLVEIALPIQQYSL